MRSRPGRDRRSTLLVCAALAVFLLAFYVLLYPIRGFRVALGSDTPVYVWWSRFAGATGLGGMGTAGRAGLVGLLATLSRTTAVPVAWVAAAAGPVLGASVAFAAGALVEATLGPDRLRFVLVVMLVGAFLSLMVAGYLSTLAFGAAFVGALATLGSGLGRASPAGDGAPKGDLDRGAGGRGDLGRGARRRGPGGWATVVGAAALIGAAGLAHALFLLLAAAVLAGALVALLPATAAQRAAGVPLPRTAGGRVVLASAGGLAVTGAGLLSALRRASPAPDTSRDSVLRRTGLRVLVEESYRRKLRHDFRWYRIVTVLGLAAVGVAARPRLEPAHGRRGWRAWAERLRARPRPALLWGAILAWAAVTAGGVVALVAGLPAPGQRLAAFCLPLPILGGIGLAALPRGRLGRPWGVAAAALGVALFVAVGEMAWVQEPLVSPAALAQSREAGAALAATPRGSPLILVADDRGDKPALLLTRYANYLRDGVPGDRVPDVRVFPGTAADLLAGRPTLTGRPEHDRLANDAWRRIRPLLARRPLVVAIRAFDPRPFRSAPPGSRAIAPGVLALVPGRWCGAGCGRAGAAVGAGPASPWLPVWLSPVLLAMLGALGLSWSTLAMPGRPLLVRLSVAPAFGVAALSLGSVAADAVGLRLAGAGGWVALALAALGWAGPLWPGTRDRGRAPTAGTRRVAATPAATSS
jgi:hypothetical protein